MLSERSLDRLASFIDAIVAIAITILILPLADQVTELHNTTTGKLFHEQSDAFISFLISFIVIAVYWMREHELFENLVGYNTALRAAALLWILGIVVLPYPTALISNSEVRDGLANALYIGTLLWLSVTAFAQAWIVDRHPQMHRADSPPEPFDLVSASMLVVLMLVALTISVLAPGVGMLSLLILFLMRPIEAWRRRVDAA